MKTISSLCINLVVLIISEASAVKLIAGDRNVVKKDGATHTISKYYVVPNDFDPNNITNSNTTEVSQKKTFYLTQNDYPKRKSSKTKAISRSNDQVGYYNVVSNHTVENNKTNKVVVNETKLSWLLGQNDTEDQAENTDSESTKSRSSDSNLEPDNLELEDRKSSNNLVQENVRFQTRLTGKANIGYDLGNPYSGQSFLEVKKDVQEDSRSNQPDIDLSKTNKHLRSRTSTTIKSKVTDIKPVSTETKHSGYTTKTSSHSEFTVSKENNNAAADYSGDINQNTGYTTKTSSHSEFTIPSDNNNPTVVTSADINQGPDFIPMVPYHPQYTEIVEEYDEPTLIIGEHPSQHSGYTTKTSSHSEFTVSKENNNPTVVSSASGYTEIDDDYNESILVHGENPSQHPGYITKTTTHSEYTIPNDYNNPTAVSSVDINKSPGFIPNQPEYTNVVDEPSNVPSQNASQHPGFITTAHSEITKILNSTTVNNENIDQYPDLVPVISNQPEYSKIVDDFNETILIHGENPSQHSDSTTKTTSQSEFIIPSDYNNPTVVSSADINTGPDFIPMVPYQPGYTEIVEDYNKPILIHGKTPTKQSGYTTKTTTHSEFTIPNYYNNPTAISGADINKIPGFIPTVPYQPGYTNVVHDYNKLSKVPSQNTPQNSGFVTTAHSKVTNNDYSNPTTGNNVNIDQRPDLVPVIPNEPDYAKLVDDYNEPILIHGKNPTKQSGYTTKTTTHSESTIPNYYNNPTAVSGADINKIPGFNPVVPYQPGYTNVVHDYNKLSNVPSQNTPQNSDFITTAHSKVTNILNDYSNPTTGNNVNIDQRPDLIPVIPNEPDYAKIVDDFNEPILIHGKNPTKQSGYTTKTTHSESTIPNYYNNPTAVSGADINKIPGFIPKVPYQPGYTNIVDDYNEPSPVYGDDTVQYPATTSWNREHCNELDENHIKEITAVPKGISLKLVRRYLKFRYAIMILRLVYSFFFFSLVTGNQRGHYGYPGLMTSPLYVSKTLPHIESIEYVSDDSLQVQGPTHYIKEETKYGEKTICFTPSMVHKMIKAALEYVSQMPSDINEIIAKLDKELDRMGDPGYIDENGVKKPMYPLDSKTIFKMLDKPKSEARTNLVLKYELPSHKEPRCREALEKLIEIAFTAYMELEQHPQCRDYLYNFAAQQPDERPTGHLERSPDLKSLIASILQQVDKQKPALDPTPGQNRYGNMDSPDRVPQAQSLNTPQIHEYTIPKKPQIVEYNSNEYKVPNAQELVKPVLNLPKGREYNSNEYNLPKVRDYPKTENHDFITPNVHDVSSPESHEYNVPKIQEYTITESHEFNIPKVSEYTLSQKPGYNAPNIQEYTLTEKHGYNVPNVQEYTLTEKHGYNVPNVQEYTIPQKPGYNVPNDQEYTLTEKHGYNVPNVQEYTIPQKPGYNVPNDQEYTLPQKPGYNVPKEFTITESHEYNVPQIHEITIQKSQSQEYNVPKVQEYTITQSNEYNIPQIHDLIKPQVQSIEMPETHETVEEPMQPEETINVLKDLLQNEPDSGNLLDRLMNIVQENQNNFQPKILKIIFPLLNAQKHNDVPNFKDILLALLDSQTDRGWPLNDRLSEPLLSYLIPDRTGNLNPKIVEIVLEVYRKKPNDKYIENILSLLRPFKEDNLDPRVGDLILKMIRLQQHNLLHPDHVDTLSKLLEPTRNGKGHPIEVDVTDLLTKWNENGIPPNQLDKLFALLKPYVNGHPDTRPIDIIHFLLTKGKNLGPKHLDFMLSFLSPKNGVLDTRPIDIVHFLLKNFIRFPNLTHKILTLLEDDAPGVLNSRFLDILLFLDIHRLLTNELVDALLNLLQNDVTGQLEENQVKNLFHQLEPYKQTNPKLDTDVMNLLNLGGMFNNIADWFESIKNPVPNRGSKPATINAVIDKVRPNSPTEYRIPDGGYQIPNVGQQLPDEDFMAIFKWLESQGLITPDQGSNTDLVNKILKVLEVGERELGVVELTYMLKHEKPLIYQPVYYVKYRLPILSFIANMKNLLLEHPNLNSDPMKLLQELIVVSNVTEVSPNLQGYPKDEILKLTFNDGDLVQAKILDEQNLSLNDQITYVHGLNSDISPEEILQLNRMNEAKYYPSLKEIKGVHPDQLTTKEVDRFIDVPTVHYRQVEMNPTLVANTFKKKIVHKAFMSRDNNAQLLPQF
ncbi:hypothetical protein PYW07_010948 [Mythimna separata]|uniref:Uncharacterized protein n=1 Tax=Mythimna separata TaxID=271217 RepID=A0AAD8DKV2_MYTSE|nr:hypothetical protein PYW07_010948 [Mythimna separata]